MPRPSRTCRRIGATLLVLAAAGAGPAGAAPLVPDDPLFPQLWGLANPVEGIDIRGPLAWGITTGSPDVLVAVLDTGIDPTHPDLVPNLRPDLSRNFVPGPDGVVDPAAWGDRNGHGTHVAGILAARGGDGAGVPGVTWRAGLVALRVCGDAGGELLCDEADVVAGIQAAGGMGARVANISLAGDAGPAVAAAIAAHPGTLFVVASGNRSGGGIDLDLSSSGQDAMCRIPAPNLICVGALDRAGVPASFGNLGRQSVDLLAPGVGILSAGLRLAPVPVGALTTTADWTAQPVDAWQDVPVDPEADPVVAAVGAPAEATLTRAAPVSFAGLRACRLQHLVTVPESADGRRLLVQTRVGDGPWVTAPSDVDPVPPPPAAPTVTRLADLSAADGAAAVHLRYRFLGAGSDATGPAFRISAPVVTCAVDAAADPPFRTLSGTSMATPHAAGVLALLAAQDPAATPAVLRGRLLGTVRPLPALAPISVTGGIPDAARALGHVDPPPVAPPVDPAPVAPVPVEPAPQPVIVPPVAPRPVALAVPGRLRADARGRVAVRVRCRATAPARCVGVVRVEVRMRGLRVVSSGARGPGVRTVVLGRAPLRLGADRVAAVRVPLTARARALLAGRRGVPVRVRLSAGPRRSARVGPLLLGSLVSARR